MPRSPLKRVEYPYLVATLVALIALSASVAHGQTSAATRRVAVAARTLARGTVLTADDFVMRDTTVRGYVDTTTVGEGWVTRRLISAAKSSARPPSSGHTR